jgi:DNA polymerase III sliding clamp (beta) subunit (PCNA family)
MKFSVSKDKLLEGLSTVQNVVSTRTTLPILSNVLAERLLPELRFDCRAAAADGPNTQVSTPTGLPNNMPNAGTVTVIKAATNTVVRSLSSLISF